MVQKAREISAAAGRSSAAAQKAPARRSLDASRQRARPCSSPVTARSKDTYLAARHARLKSRRGASKATGATRHAILLAAHAILDRNVAYAELGPDYFHRRHDPEQQTRRLIRQLEHLGHTVTLHPAEAA